VSGHTTNAKPTMYQADLARLPRALAPLLERSQWAIWRLIPRPGGGWQKPPFMATQPNRHASVTDPSTWADYKTALAAVQVGHGDGLSYILTKQDGFAAVDLDYCRDTVTGSVDGWAQLMLEQALHSYCEITPSGNGLRIWGTAAGNSLHRAFELDTGDKAKVELFRATNKALTISGLDLRQGRKFGNIDRLMDWCVFFGERHKPVPKVTAAPIYLNGNGGCGYSVDEIEEIVRNGAASIDGGNRSNLFHTIVGHYTGCGWPIEQTFEHLHQYPNGIGERYLAEGRLSLEISRSFRKWRGLPPLSSDELKDWTAEWMDAGGLEAKAPRPSLEPDPELDDDLDSELEPKPAPDPELDDDVEPDPDLDDDVDDDDELEDDVEPSKPKPGLPPLYAHGDPDPRPVKSWLVKHLIPACGHGLISGQWGAGKTFVVFDLAAALGSGQPFLNHVVKRQCGFLLIAAEGASEVRLRLDAVITTKCGGTQRAPFRWYETAPMLLHKGAIETLIAMARQAEASLQEEFGLPLGLIVIDTVAACAGYARAGDENDPAVGQALMNVLKVVAQELNCFVFGVAHFGKNLESGTRGASSLEASGDVVLACLGDKELSGNVINTRLAVRKNRGGQQGREYPFVLRMVTASEPDEDNEPVTTMVVDWTAVPPAGAQPQYKDPWAQGRRQEQRTVALRLKKVLMSVLADEGVELSIPPDGPIVRMVDQEIIRREFYARTPVEGTTKQKGDLRRQQFNRALSWAEAEELIAIGEIGEITYLWLMPQEPDNEEEDDEGKA
jgi:hypothetical protein